jgi:hypothetical protein
VIHITLTAATRREARRMDIENLERLSMPPSEAWLSHCPLSEVLERPLIFPIHFDFSALGEDIAERPYITVGFANFCMLSALAATSTKRSTLEPNARRWRNHARDVLQHRSHVGGSGSDSAARQRRFWRVHRLPTRGRPHVPLIGAQPD